MATDDRSEIHIRSRWGEIDSNGHMRNVAYLDISANSRMEFFNANGYTLTEFFGAGLGPVVLKSSERGSDSIALIKFSGGAIVLRVAISKKATRLEILHASFPLALRN